MPEWFLVVPEQSQLATINDRLYLITPSGGFEIDLQTGNKKLSMKEFVKSKNIEIGKTGTDNEVKKWKIETDKNKYSFVEAYSKTDDCQLSSRKYWLEQTDKIKGNGFYMLGKSERYYVLDFKIIKQALYIIKNPANGGDAFHLEKYNLRKTFANKS